MNLKLGFDYKKSNIRYYKALHPVWGYVDNSVLRYGYDETALESDETGIVKSNAVSLAPKLNGPPEKKNG